MNPRKGHARFSGLRDCSWHLAHCADVSSKPLHSQFSLQVHETSKPLLGRKVHTSSTVFFHVSWLTNTSNKGNKPMMFIFIFCFQNPRKVIHQNTISTNMCLHSRLQNMFSLQRHSAKVNGLCVVLYFKKKHIVIEDFTYPCTI